MDALSHPDDEPALRFKRMLLAQATALIMPGVPGIYFHSLVGTGNYHDGVKHTGNNRSINREKFNIDWLENELKTQGGLAKTMFDSYKRLISIRISEPAFNPYGGFRFFNLDKGLFAMEQEDLEGKEHIFIVHNFTNTRLSCTIPDEISLPLSDLLSPFESDETRELSLEAYEMMWLKLKPKETL
jgi:sucrose phosphorylase